MTIDTIDTHDSELNASIAARIAPVQPTGARASTTRLRLFDRVRQSAQAHLEYVTIRREDGDWQHATPNQRIRNLHGDAQFSVDIIQLRTGTELLWPQAAIAQEILVLEGALVPVSAPVLANLSDAAVGNTNLPQKKYAFQVRHAAQPGLPLQAVGETTLYVRTLLVAVDQLPVLEARWWQLAAPASGWVDPMRRRWVTTGPGVDVLPLRGDADVVSMLVRFAPGASVPDHGHALNEDCLVLEGEMFLGDILLRTGDYQLAPAGGSHFNENSDVGVLFFFHGALDPVLKEIRK